MKPSWVYTKKQDKPSLRALEHKNQIDTGEKLKRVIAS